MIEGRHWLPGQDMADIAWKLVAVNLSDLAAKGAEPVGILLGHTLGDGDDRFLEGLHEVLTHYGVKLLGGDTVAGDGARTLGCTAIGRATHRPVPARRGARSGDAIYVTGPVGAAMLGFEALRDGKAKDSTAYLRPAPLLAEGRALAPHVTAMMDISDGLLLDCWRMASAGDGIACGRLGAIYDDQLALGFGQHHGGDFLDLFECGFGLLAHSIRHGFSSLLQQVIF